MFGIFSSALQQINSGLQGADGARMVLLISHAPLSLGQPGAEKIHVLLDEADVKLYGLDFASQGGLAGCYGRKV